MPQIEQEELRIRQAYARRDATGKARLYGWERRDSAYMAYRQKVAWIAAFKEAGFVSLANLEIIDIGCGAGGWLRQTLAWGADPSRLHGLDLLEDRIIRAKVLSPPTMDFRVGNACGLDYPNNAMDLCVASTVFSSVLDPVTRRALAIEMTRVVRPGGWIMIFDYAISDPRNPDVIGMRKSEICRIFPDVNLEKVFKLIFPPPVLRLLPSRLIGIAHCLELFFPFLCTHRLYLIRK
jgi:ubiquinone/menaquinone biosynthesis C-methylase UbiE